MFLFKKLLRKLRPESLPLSELPSADEEGECSNSLAHEIPAHERVKVRKRSPTEILAPLPQSLTAEMTTEIESPAKNYLDSGLACYQSGDYEQAITFLTRTIELAPDFARAYSYRGAAYDKAGNLQQAIQDFNKAIELDSDFAVAYYDRGIVYVDSGDLEQAIRDFTRAIELDPSFAVAYNNRGAAYRMSGNPEQAIRDYDSAIEIAPHYADAYNNRGFAYAGSRDLERAIRDFSTAIELNPAHELAYRHRGHAYYTSGNLEQAIQDLDRAIELCPEDAIAHACQGLAYLDGGNADMAHQDFLVAARIDPDEVDFTQLRMAYARSSKYDPYAVKDGIDRALTEVSAASEGTDLERITRAVNKVLEMNYLILNTHITAALTYTKAGDTERATHHQQFVRHWTQSIQQSGNGQSFPTAFVVVSLDEEYAMLKVLGALFGFQRGRQRLGHHEDHIFDIFEVRDLKTGKTSEILFNIDLIMKGIQEGRAELPAKH